VKWIPDYVVNGPAPGPGDLMFVLGLYKVHHSTTGSVTNASNVITNVRTGVLLASDPSWIPGDRIRDDGRLLPPDTYVTAYDQRAATITLSQPVTAPTPPGGQVVNLYDAEVRTFTSTQVY
jgi:hypothetical protein